MLWQADTGPVFGGSADLNLSPPNAYTYLGYTYKCPVNAGQFNTAPCNNYLGGRQDLQIADYEVFVVKPLN